MPTNNESENPVRDTWTQFAQIKPGDVVVDLGSGAGNDCFVARTETGETGRVIGLDIAPTLIEQARQTANRLGYTNVEFVQGAVEAMPLERATADVVMSNCGLNQVPDKLAAFDEIYRILKPGGHFCIADTMLVGTLPDQIRDVAEHHAGGTGVIQEALYLDIINMSGFEQITSPGRTPIHLPDELLKPHLSADELAKFRASGAGLFSVTICAEKIVSDVLTLSAADLAMPLATTQKSDPDEDDLDDDDLARFDILGSL